MEKAKRGTGGIIFEADPKTLVTKVVQALDEAERELMRNA
jgi:hypothetical protein